MTAAEARRTMGCRVRPAVVLPDGSLIDERRARERRRDQSQPVWIPALSASLRVRFPEGSRVSGPFRSTGRGVWRDGEGIVAWGMAEAWAVPEIGVPIRVQIGNRWSGGYLPEELIILEEPAQPIPAPVPEPTTSRPCIVCREPARWGSVCDSCRAPEPEPEEQDELVVDDEVLEILQEAGFTS